MELNVASNGMKWDGMEESAKEWVEMGKSGKE